MYQLDLFHINNVSKPCQAPIKKVRSTPPFKPSALVNNKGIFFMRLVTNFTSEALGKFMQVFNKKS
jgi:hypothetical protein